MDSKSANGAAAAIHASFNQAWAEPRDSLGGPPEHRALEHAQWQRELERLLASGLLAPDARILDFGAGSGHWSMFLAQRLPRARITGIDFAERAIAAASARARELCLENVSFILYDGGSLPVFAEPFDCILCLGVLLYVNKAGTFERLLEPLTAALAPGGLLCVVELFRGRSREGATFKTFEKRALLAQLEALGFQRLCDRPIYFSKAARYWVQATGARSPLRPLWRAFQSLDRAVDALLLKALRLPFGERRLLLLRKQR